MNDSPIPHRSELLAIAAVAIVLRVAVIASAMYFKPLTLAQFTSKGDTTSYMAVASAMTGQRSLHSLDEYDRRVFPGYPALIALVRLCKIPLPIAALAVTTLSAAVAAAAAARIFQDARIGWAMTCLIPHYLINSSLGMSEAPLLAAVCLGLLLFQSNRLLASGIFFGFAGLIRPMACFPLAGAALVLLRRRRFSRASLLLTGAAASFALGFMLYQFWTGDALLGIRVYAHAPGAYAGHMIVAPFYSLITESARASISRNIYTWFHVLLTFCALILSAVFCFKKPHPDPLDQLSFPWLLGNTALLLCIGPPWGFLHFSRFMIPALPPLFWTLRRFLPRARPIWYAVALASIPLAVIGVMNAR